MEVSGTVLRHVTHVSGASQYRGRGVVPRGGVTVRRTVMGCGFCDEGHVQYYQDRKNQQPALTSKKKLKLLKGLSKGASSFPQLGFALDNLQGNLNTDVGEVELLLRELEKLRAEKKELKKRKKQEKKAKLEASRMKTVPDCKSESSSSSSESESSDSECDKVVDMNTFRAGVGVELLQPPPPASQSTMLSPPTTVDADAMKLCSRNDDVSVGSVSTVGFKNESNVVATAPQKRIEVCMGNKCKRSGSAALLQEFERVMVGVEGGAVVGCKCMGKCRSAPNVRIQSSSLDHGLAEGLSDSVKVPVNPLCIGVGLEDVNAIVARFLGEENHTDMGMAAAST